MEHAVASALTGLDLLHAPPKVGVHRVLDIELVRAKHQTVALERTIIAGASAKQTEVRARGEELAGHLRALLSDVICGHLDADLATLADELLLSPEESPAGEQADGSEEVGAGPAGFAAWRVSFRPGTTGLGS